MLTLGSPDETPVAEELSGCFDMDQGYARVAPGVLFGQQPQNGFALSIGETRIVKAPPKQRRILPVDEFVHH
jgi:hypothetical protein